MKPTRIATAFLLGAGLGTRLRPLTEACPKPLLRVDGRPIITYAMDHLLTAGVRRFIVNTHHCAHAYSQAFPDARWRGVPIVFRHEPILLDTAGGLKNIEDLLESDERLIVYNADVISDLPLEPLLEAHLARACEATLVLRSEGPLRNVDLDATGRICDMRRKLNRPGVKTCSFAGIYIVEKRFLTRLTAGAVESVVPVFVRMIAEQPGSVGGVLIDGGQWHDIGNGEAYRNMTERPPILCYEKDSDVQAVKVQSRPEDNEQAKPFDVPAEKAVKRYVNQVLGLREDEIVKIEPLAKGGSDRTFRRIVIAGAPPRIFMYYNSGREENRLYGTIAGFLAELDIAVPRIFHHDAHSCMMLMEDLGDVDLWSLRHLAWNVRRDHYRKALRMIRKLHAYPLEKLRGRPLPLMQGFGPVLYHWERNYFMDNLVRAVCGIKPCLQEAAALEAELDALAFRLHQTAKSLVHRDFQSQNIMIAREEPVLIDFQGMRTGTYFYDLGSLLYDPYVPIDETQRMELLEYYYGLDAPDESWNAFQESFHEASVQRLMQALGAFGFLGLQHDRRDFLVHIPAGLQRLAEAVVLSGRLPTLQGLVERCQCALNAERLKDERG